MKMMKVWAAGMALVLSAGVAMAQGRRGGFGGPGRGGFGGPTSLLRIPEVQKELKIEDPQLDLIRQVQQEQGEKMRAMFQGSEGLSREERQKQFEARRPQMEQLTQETEKKIGEILDKKQMARLKQLSIQRDGTRALGRKDVQDELKLTADQRSKVEAAFEAQGEAMRAAFQGVDFANMTDTDRQAIRAKMEQLRTQNDAKIMGILTDPQKKQYQTMQGAPFKFPEGGFGFGGRRRQQQ